MKIVVNLEFLFDLQQLFILFNLYYFFQSPLV